MEHDPRDPARFLAPDERLYWVGRPSPKAKSGAGCVIRSFGCLSLFAFFFFVAMTLANLDEMEGAWGFMIAFLVLSFTLVLAFGVAAPILERKSLRCTRFAVTSRGILVIRGLSTPRVIRLPILPGQEIVMSKDFGGLWRVRFFHKSVRKIHESQAGLGDRTVIQHHFNGLTQADAEAAKQAMEYVQQNHPA